MHWIESNYTNTSGEQQPVWINLKQVRSIRKTDKGMARILWARAVDPLVLDESYESFIQRIGKTT